MEDPVRSGANKFLNPLNKLRTLSHNTAVILPNFVALGHTMCLGVYCSQMWTETGICTESVDDVNTLKNMTATNTINVSAIRLLLSRSSNICFRGQHGWTNSINMYNILLLKTSEHHHNLQQNSISIDCNQLLPANCATTSANITVWGSSKNNLQNGLISSVF